MKTIIAGSRRIPSLGLNEPDDWKKPELRAVIFKVLEEIVVASGYEIDTVVSGTCWGIDQLGEEWADKNGKPIIYYPANWKRYYKFAGKIRNEEMAKAGDALICLYAKGSAGSLHMVNCMKKLGKPFFTRTF